MNSSWLPGVLVVLGILVAAAVYVRALATPDYDQVGSEDYPTPCSVGSIRYDENYKNPTVVIKC